MRLIKAVWPLLFVLFYYSCSQSTEPDQSIGQDNELIDKYLVEYNRQGVSVKEPIILRFNSNFVSDSALQIVEGVDIKPDVKGEWSWLNNGALRFTPTEHFDYDQQYQLALDLPVLLGNDNIKDEILKWSFKTKELQSHIKLLDLRIPSSDPAESMSLKGEVKTSDYIEPLLIEESIKVSQPNNETISIHWDHRENGTLHVFTIKNIQQDEIRSGQLKVAWGNLKLDKNYKGEEIIDIPAKGGFELMYAQINQESDKIIELYFSRPIDPNQNMSGLITIDQHAEKIKTDVQGSVIYLYPSKALLETFSLYVSDKIRSSDGQTLNKDNLLDLRFDLAKPATRSVGSGMIIPSAVEAVFSFDAINLRAVDVEIFKIFDNNVLQFLQSNTINDGYYLSPVGRIVWQGKVPIEGASKSKNEWLRVGVDLKDYLAKDPAAIYQIRIGFQKEYAISECEFKDSQPIVYRDGTESFMNYTDEYYQDYQGRDNPCSPSYYSPDQYIRRNLMMSDVGIIVKGGENRKFRFALSHLATGQPLANYQVSLYDFQQQLLVQSITSADGFLDTVVPRDAAFAIASGPEGYGYVKLDDQNSNSLTEFDVAGGRDPGVVDGYIYTDRGVYRPGDSIYLNFMLDDSRERLPVDHPITLQVFDPRGVEKLISSKRDHVGKIYSFIIPTGQNEATGRWRAQINVGPHKFYSGIRVEAIKPNRLKVDIKAPDEMLYFRSEDRNIAIESRWLHGAPAKGLGVQVDAQLNNFEPVFKEYPAYSFIDPARQGASGINTWHKGKLDESGLTNFKLSLDTRVFPGKINAQLKTRVFEEGGNFSENYSAVNISPFESYVGVKIPENRWGYKSVQIGEESIFDIVVLDNDGRPRSGENLSVGIYDIAWQWWYYQGDRYNIYRLNSAEHKEAFYSTDVKSDRNGKVQLKLDLQDIEYGRKMIRICNTDTGHCTGDFFYATSYGAPQEEAQRESLAKLSFTSDKDTYESGEQVKMRIPSEVGSRLLISIEDGKEVIMQEWLIGQKDFTEYQFQSSAEMTPNVYIHVSMVQSYDDKNNDLPIRMYGVLPITIVNQKTELQPIITMPDQLEPKHKFDLVVQEKQNRPMSYTVAIVDEGLLDLTTFKTPDPHGHFYAKRSLGVKTWDMYSHVLTGVSSRVDRMISVGGDGDVADREANKKAIRFKPVVMVGGPYHIAAGASAKHSFTMPNYMGSVRAMIIAREDDAYGHVDKTIPVKNPIMILPTLPRVLSPGEEVSIPVTVFATEPDVRNVKVRIQTDEHIEIIGGNEKRLFFEDVGEKVIYFKGKVGTELGIAQVLVAADGNGHRIDQSLELDIRNPNPYTAESYQQVVGSGESWTTSFEKQGMKGTNEGLLELSTLPSMNLRERMDYLLRYPYGCLEQTTSAAMPQLYIGQITKLSAEESNKVDKNINQAIRRIVKQQRSNGGFNYWPDAQMASAWGSSYAGHFLTLASQKGYFVSSQVLAKWINYQNEQARAFQLDRTKKEWLQNRQKIDQAYRLYSMAVYGEPNLPAMNVLRQESSLPSLAQYLLAGAYAYAGKKDIARELVADTKTDIKPYRELSYTYGSDLRDQALIAQTLLLLDRRNEAGSIIKDIAQKMNTNRWYSTQTTAQAIMAMGQFLKGHSGEPMRAQFTLGSQSMQEVTTDQPIFLFEFDPDENVGDDIVINNLSGDVLYANVTLSGQKSPEKVTMVEPVTRNISMTVNYKSMTGKVIDPAKLTRGTDFIAEVNVKNLKSRGTLLEGLALTQIFPSGWEIQSGGLSNVSSALKEDSYTYRDVGDDRVYTYFDLYEQKVFKILLTATYDGVYFLPPVSCEAMYDAEIKTSTKGLKVEVIAPSADE